MSDQDNTTHEERIEKLLLSILTMQALEMSLHIAKSGDLPDYFLESLTSQTGDIIEKVRKLITNEKA